MQTHASKSSKLIKFIKINTCYKSKIQLTFLTVILHSVADMLY